MKKYLMSSIATAVQEDYVDLYKNAANFVNTRLFYQCMNIVENVDNLRRIVAENDKGIPPVQTLLGLFEEQGYQIAEMTTMKADVLENLWHLCSSMF